MSDKICRNSSSIVLKCIDKYNLKKSIVN